MNAEQQPLKDNPLWKFSVEFYRQPGVADALLFLQKQYGFNVNLMLYFFWQAMLGQGGLSQIRVRQQMLIVAPWHNKVVLPLRRLRDTLKHYSAEQHDIEVLRKEILQEELNAEQVEQLMLYQQQWHISPRVRSPLQTVVDICRSVASYCYLMRVKADQHLTDVLDVLLHALLGQLTREEIAQTTAERLHNHPKMSKVVGTQLWLDL